jgi:hypothetical protein
MSAHLSINRSSVTENQTPVRTMAREPNTAEVVIDAADWFSIFGNRRRSQGHGPTVTPSPYGQHQMGPITGAYLNRERWRVMIGLTIRLVLFVALMSVILMGVFSVFGIILLLLVAAPILFIFALL